MSDKKPPKSNLSSEDADLWKEMTRDVKRMEGREYEEGVAEKEQQGADLGEERPKIRETYVALRQETSKTPATGQGLDKRTEERLRKGEMQIDARLDMHGFRQDEAKPALEGFIERCYNEKKRCVLVITGKGKTGAYDAAWYEPEPGVLKRMTPEWLSAAEMKPYILKFVPAQPKDGGDGALYVLLRRHRTR